LFSWTYKGRVILNGH